MNSVEDMGELEHLQTLEGHTDRVWGLAWNPTNTNLLASCSGDKTVRIWEQSFSGSFNCKFPPSTSKKCSPEFLAVLYFLFSIIGNQKHRGKFNKTQSEKK
ncbi:hypothetical protein BVRB_4g095270 [Beta vulgaris subsp. vulgaris]|uniref:Uncharacterized protein n=1 Tax=Beta vulgaris subsp. vulgaris TaxID=3555 RepID=A0A0J8E4S3_BETVV|nr:hypothetical protein BVRB_4g095270 [Beta vulgaris subsp. vulgaris]